ncbi:hypothetical protein [Glycomyces sp. NPDC047010]|uniref:hypothetical protein n=1 Tax=Glycomyces sp. NPDC047010 TaxID=3155023 RepID=UPI0033FD8B62
MSEEITIRLGEGILRRFAVRTSHGPVVAVRLLADGTLVQFEPERAPDDTVTLVAVHLHHRTKPGRKRRGRVLVRRTTIETPIVLGHGRLVVFASIGAAPVDAVTIRPKDPSEGPWLNEAAIAQVHGKPVRLEALHHPFASHHS